MKILLIATLAVLTSMPLAGETKERKVVSYGKIEYPAAALAKNESDIFGVEVHVTATGEAKASVNPGHEDFAEESIKFANSWKFEPGKEEVLHAVFSFKITDKGAEANSFDPEHLMLRVVKKPAEEKK